tara:strand:+ start:269810 stop:270433 length:624 start_codon:yes stop_codon:yes gene_type:complete
MAEEHTTGDHIRAKATIKMLGGQASNLINVMNSVIEFVHADSKARYSPLRLMDPLFRAVAMMKISDADHYFGKGLSTNSIVNAVASDLRRNAGGRISSSKNQTAAARRQLVAARGCIERIQVQASKAAPDNNPSDAGQGNPSQWLEKYITKRDEVQSFSLKELSKFFGHWAKFADIIGFDRQSRRNLRKISKRLLTANKRLRRSRKL